MRHLLTSAASIVLGLILRGVYPPRGRASFDLCSNLTGAREERRFFSTRT